MYTMYMRIHVYTYIYIYIYIYVHMIADTRPLNPYNNVTRAITYAKVLPYSPEPRPPESPYSNHTTTTTTATNTITNNNSTLFSRTLFTREPLNAWRNANVI